MKKLFKLFLLTIISISFVSCSPSSKDVSKMYFEVKDTAVVDDDYYTYSYLIF